MEILGCDQRKTIEFDLLHVMDRLIVVIALTQGKSLVFLLFRAIFAPAAWRSQIKIESDARNFKGLRTLAKLV